MDCNLGITVKKAVNSIITSNNISGCKKIGLSLIDSLNNIISRNNFINNFESVYFLNSFNNRWNQNFWNHLRLLPMIIFGKVGIEGFTIVYNFDLDPARQPYNI